MSRRSGWEARLFALVADASEKPYTLGTHDCFSFACAVVEALTGVDRWPEFVGYTTKRGALEAIAKHGSNFEVAGDWFFGVPHSYDMRRYQRGDIAALQTEDGEKHLGVVLGAHTAFLAPGGLLYVLTSTCLCLWAVG